MAKYRYGYDQGGNLVKSLDILNGIEYNYYYKGERIQRATESAVELRRISGCKTENVVSKTLKHSVNGEANKTTYEYTYDAWGVCTVTQNVSDNGCGAIAVYNANYNNKNYSLFEYIDKLNANGILTLMIWGIF